MKNTPLIKNSITDGHYLPFVQYIGKPKGAILPVTKLDNDNFAFAVVAESYSSRPLTFPEFKNNIEPSLKKVKFYKIMLEYFKKNNNIKLQESVVINWEKNITYLKTGGNHENKN